LMNLLPPACYEAGEAEIMSLPRPGTVFKVDFVRFSEITLVSS